MMGHTGRALQGWLQRDDGKATILSHIWPQKFKAVLGTIPSWDDLRAKQSPLIPPPPADKRCFTCVRCGAKVPVWDSIYS